MTASQTTKPPGKPQKPDRAQREGRRSRNRERESLCPAGAFPAVASTDKPSTSNSLPPAPRTRPRSPPPPPPYPRPPNLTPPLCHTMQRKKSPPHTNDWEPFSPLRSLLTADGSAPGLFFTSETSRCSSANYHLFQQKHADTPAGPCALGALRPSVEFAVRCRI